MLKLPSRVSVIFELCEGCMKIGFAGDNRPRFVLPMKVDRLSAQDNPLDLRLYYGNLFRNVFYEYLHVKTKTVSVLIVEPLYWPSAQRNAVFSSLVIDFQVMSVSMQPSLMMIIPVSGVTAGIIINIGRKTSEILCFSNSRSIILSYKSVSLGVGDFSAALLGRDNASSVAELEKMKSQIIEQGQKVLPDGRVIDSLAWNRALSTLIDASDAPSSSGLAELILESVLTCATDDRCPALQHLIFTGEGAFLQDIPNFTCQRIIEIWSDPAVLGTKFGPIAQTINSSKINGQLRPLQSPFSIQDLGWIGGSLFACIPGNAPKYTKREDALLLARSIESSTCESSGSGNMLLDTILQAPDWLSIDTKDWRFFSPLPPQRS